MAWEQLQPSSIFSKEKSSVIGELVRKPNDRFWIIPVAKYEKILTDNINKMKDIDKGSKEYLIGLIQYLNDDIKEAELKKLHTKNNIPDSDIIKNFGEVLGPFHALKILQKSVRDKMHNVVFPIRQNYEIFDFFIKDGVHYGFSSKALSGGSNPLVPRVFIERLDKVKDKSQFRKFQTEIDVLKELTDGGMFSGVVNAFGLLIKSKKLAKGFDKNVITLFNGVDFASDARKMESNKEKFISELKLSKQKAYETFLTDYVFDNISTQKQKETKDLSKKDKNGYGYQSVNVVYGMIKYISSVQGFNFDDIMKALFQDLYILKMGLTKEGIPKFELQTTIDAKKVFELKSFYEGDSYAFRSKASWDRVRDKLGIQL